MKVVSTILAVVVLLALLLAVHVYVVTRPRADGRTRAMARIDLHQSISKTDADSITAWLYRQKGVDRVLVNPKSAIAVFVFSPVMTNANAIVRAFKASLPYSRAERYLPAGAQLKRGCPMTATPVTNKIYQFLKQLF
jgi:YD repeat-containing protein